MVRARGVRAQTRLRREDGDQWRVNFSRVEWRTEVVDGAYVKVAGSGDGQASLRGQLGLVAAGAHRDALPRDVGIRAVLDRCRGTAEKSPFVPRPRTTTRAGRCCQVYYARARRSTAATACTRTTSTAWICRRRAARRSAGLRPIAVTPRHVRGSRHCARRRHAAHLARRARLARGSSRIPAPRESSRREPGEHGPDRLDHRARGARRARRRRAPEPGLHEERRRLPGRRAAPAGRYLISIVARASPASAPSRSSASSR